jgi:RNA polymerase sigma-70 factor (ECF subfamily)
MVKEPSVPRKRALATSAAVTDGADHLDDLLHMAFRCRPEAVAPLAQRIRATARQAKPAKRSPLRATAAKVASQSAAKGKGKDWAKALDEELLAAARNGDAEAFGELTHRLKRRLIAAAMHITRNQHDAEDIVQTACLNAFSHIASFRGECAFSTWLLRITVNEALACSRESRRAQLNTEDLDDYEEGSFQERPLGDWHAVPESLAARNQLRVLLRAELDKLPLKYSSVFVMRDVEGFSTAEVAEALNLTLTAVRVRLLRARSKLRQRLQTYLSGPDALPELKRFSGARGIH